MEQFCIDVNIKCPNFLKIPHIGIPIRVRRGDRHESPHPHMGFFQGRLRRREGILRGKADLGRLPAHVVIQRDDVIGIGETRLEIQRILRESE